jgi:hypothetical protein
MYVTNQSTVSSTETTTATTTNVKLTKSAKASVIREHRKKFIPINAIRNSGGEQP